MDVRVGLWRKLNVEELMLLNCGVGEDSWESLGLQGDPTSPFWRRAALGFHWKEWCWSWNCSTLATSCEELTHWKRLWCWEGLGAGGKGDNRGWDGWMALPTWCMWVWVNSRSWWWTGRPGVVWFMGSQRVGQDWTELNWISRCMPPGWNLQWVPKVGAVLWNWTFKLKSWELVSELNWTVEHQIDLWRITDPLDTRGLQIRNSSLPAEILALLEKINVNSVSFFFCTIGLVVHYHLASSQVLYEKY